MPKAKKGPKQAAQSTEIVVLLDRSGSMQSIKNDMVQGFDAFVKEQQKQPGACVVTLTQFDTQGVDTVYEAKPVADVPSLVLEPRGGTPLLDAMGQTITRVANRLNATTAKPDRVLFLVLTDGEENSSREFKRDQIKKLVEQYQTVDKWVFSFLGANIDSFAEAGSLGIAQTSTMNYSPDSAGVKHAFASVSTGASALRSGGIYSVSSTDPRHAKKPA